MTGGYARPRWPIHLLLVLLSPIAAMGQRAGEWFDVKRPPNPLVPTPAELQWIDRASSAAASQRSIPSGRYDSELLGLTDQLTAAIAERYGIAAERRGMLYFDCRAPLLAALHLRALKTLGEHEQCVALAESCLSGLAAHPEWGGIAYQGGRCAVARNDFARGFSFFDLSTRPSQAASPEFAGRVYGFARWANFSDFPEWTRAILARNPAWVGSEDLIVGVMEYLQTGATKRASPAAVEAEVRGWMAGDDPILREAATLGWSGHLGYNRYQFREALRWIAGALQELRSPESWYPLTYISSYRQPVPNFELARGPYRAVLPFLDPTAWLPTAYNPYTYTEIAQGVCRGALTEDSDAEELVRLQQAWQSGAILLDAALVRAFDLDRRSPGRADLLTWIGTLHEIRGQDEAARWFYWRAHQVCPWYNRSHDGLDGIELRAYREAFSDTGARRSAADSVARSLGFPPELERYVVNWPTLPTEGRERFKYAARIFVHHVPFLYASGARVYVKHVFERLSDVPGLEYIRDARVHYANDNRLWDDVGGASTGALAVVTYADVLDAPFTGYDVIAHEMAHQFHYFAPSHVQACIATLYQGARSRDRFADPYSAINEAEYFAQGVAQYLVPADAPPRFGLTVTWLIENDPDLYRFIQGVERAGSVGELTCSVGLGD